MALSRRRFVWLLAKGTALAPVLGCTASENSSAPGTLPGEDTDGGEPGADAGAGEPDAGHDAGAPELPPVDAQPAFDFLHGVASGDPLADRVILWTRLTLASADDVAANVDLTVDFVVATDPQLENVVGRGRAVTNGDRDYTVKVDVTGLSPATAYYYEFYDPASPTLRSSLGRTRTLPTGSVERARFAVVSCSCYALGFFHSYADIAARSDLDAVLHLGDYIYEYGPDVYQDDMVMRPHAPNHEIVTLLDYRTRYAQYRTDPDLQEAHRQHPFITIWDDHETANDAWRDGAENHTDGSEGSYVDRRTAALTAYHDWMPIRELDPNDLTRIYRSFAFGDLFDLMMLETRTKRDKQDRASASNAARTMMGPEQTAWLEEELSASQRRGTSWRVLGQQVMFGQLRLPIIGMLNADQWDGYDANRTRLFDHVESEGIDNLLVLTGDIHSAWAMDIARDPYTASSYDKSTGQGALAVEFVCTSITSPALEILGQLGSVAGSAVVAANPHIKFVDLYSHGYCLVDIDPTRIQGEWHTVADIKSLGGRTHTFAKAFTVESGTPHLVETATPTLPIAGRAPLA